MIFDSDPFYHGSIRSLIVAFGSLFSTIKFQRKNKDGVVEQTIKVPIAYSQKEKWVHSIEANPDSERGIYAALPRMGYEITGYSYDAQRKLPRANKLSCVTEDGRNYAFVPVPYNVDISLYFATKTMEDGLQILEQILPGFSPEHTVSFKAIPELNITLDVPLTLNSVTVQDDYEGDLETRRFVIHTLTFTAKTNLFSGINDVGLIKQVEVNMEEPKQFYIATQETPTAEIIEQWLTDF